MAGLLLLKEFKNWTTAEATDAYLFDYRVQYALNIGRDKLSFCERTLERYMAIMRDDKLAIQIFDTVTAKLIEDLDINISNQRLDSTHVFSDMATFARTKLMGVAIKRLLVQIKRHHSDPYESIDADFRKRYEKPQSALFADHSKDKVKRSNLRQEVAEQLHKIITLFNGHAQIENMDSYKRAVEIFNQQCEIISPIEVEKESGEGEGTPTPSEENKGLDQTEATEIIVKKKTGGNVIQNPSDPDATYDGHKGVGYQVQICETSNDENEVQLVTSILPETAVNSDAKALQPMVEKLENAGLLPDELQADTLYGSDDNYVFSRGKGVELTSPVSGLAPGKPSEKPMPKQIRLNKRRAEQETKEWKKKYNSRAQIEGTIGSIKRLTGMVRLRYRGELSIFSAIELKLTGWNISRALTCASMQKKLSKIIKKRREQARWVAGMGVFSPLMPTEFALAA